MDDSILEDKQSRWVPWLAAITALAAIYAIAVAWSGGFTIHLGPVRMRSHSWARPGLAAAVGVGLLAYFASATVLAAARRASRAAESARAAAIIAAAAGAWAFAAGVVFGTFAVGGADSYGYAGQARLLAHGRLTDTVPASREYTWPDVVATFTPLGFSPGRAPGIIAPKYPPGLPLLMAPLSLISEHAIYLLVPCFGALLVWLTFRLGTSLGDPVAGGVAAVLLSASPTFLYQVVQPMSDVPAAACWLAALLVASRATTSSTAASAVLASIAVTIRPNLVPLALIVLVVATFSVGAPMHRGAASRLRRAAAFAVAILPGLALLAWIQSVRYGSPLASGYGSASDVFAFAYIRENLARYPRWITETHTWFIWLSCAAPAWIARRATRPVLAWGALGLATIIWASYLPYLYFHPDEWFYTRFLLPAIPVMFLFAAAIVVWALRPLSVIVRTAAIVVVTTVMAVHGVQAARNRGAFDVRNQERKYPLAGAFVRDHLPSNAIVLAAQHSGSVRYYADRPTFRWDLLSPTRLDQALATFRSQGYQPYLVVDGGEYDEFRMRFEAAGQRAARRPVLLAITGDARVYALE
jgi:hypothetical protein